MNGTDIGSECWRNVESAGLSGAKVLTVREPWASLLVTGFKTVENRSRRFNHRGPLLIHASKSLTETYYEAAYLWVKAHVDPDLYRFPTWGLCRGNRGKIIGGVSLDDCAKEAAFNPWRDDSEWGLAVSGAWRAAVPVPAKGALGLWTFKG